MYAEMSEDRDVEQSERTQPAMIAPSNTVPDESASRTLTGGAKAGDVKIYAVLMMTSFIEFIAAIRHCSTDGICSKEYGFMLFVGLISCLICLSFIIATRKAIAVTPAGLQGLAIFLLIWWVLGAGIGTFYGPFNATGNGYFSAWLSLALALYNAYVTLPKVKAAVDNASARRKDVSKDDAILLVLLVSSLVTLIEGVNLCEKLDYCSGTLGWTVSVGTISSFLTLLVVVPKLKPLVSAFTFQISCFLAVFWIPGAGIMTFSGPFTHTGNGYFAAWAGLFSAVYWAFKEIQIKHPEWLALEQSPQV